MLQENSFPRMWEVYDWSVTSEEANSKSGLDSIAFDRAVIGALLKSARESLGVSLKHVEAVSGVAASHIWNIEKGKKEVSTERLVRLASFYGFPIGLLLEAGIQVKPEPFLKAAQSDTGELLKILGWRKVPMLRRELMAEFIAALAVILTYLLRSTRPAFLVESFDFPSFKLKHLFRLRSSLIEFRLPPHQRMIALAQLMFTPVRPLHQLKLIRAEDISEFEQLAITGKLPFPLPWRPVPKAALADFNHAVHIEAMTKEEFEFINSLRKSVREHVPPVPVFTPEQRAKANEIKKQIQKLQSDMQAITSQGEPADEMRLLNRKLPAQKQSA
jgi:transcriptional regulator with XRE-family HTH domain